LAGLQGVAGLFSDLSQVLFMNTQGLLLVLMKPLQVVLNRLGNLNRLSLGVPSKLVQRLPKRPSKLELML
jgi:hypothetical protein